MKKYISLLNTIGSSSFFQKDTSGPVRKMDYFIPDGTSTDKISGVIKMSGFPDQAWKA